MAAPRLHHNTITSPVATEQKPSISALLPLLPHLPPDPLPARTPSVTANLAVTPQLKTLQWLHTARKPFITSQNNAWQALAPASLSKLIPGLRGQEANFCSWDAPAAPSAQFPQPSPNGLPDPDLSSNATAPKNLLIYWLFSPPPGHTRFNQPASRSSQPLPLPGATLATGYLLADAPEALPGHRPAWLTARPQAPGAAPEPHAGGCKAAVRGTERSEVPAGPCALEGPALAPRRGQHAAPGRGVMTASWGRGSPGAAWARSPGVRPGGSQPRARPRPPPSSRPLGPARAPGLRPPTVGVNAPQQVLPQAHGVERRGHVHLLARLEFHLGHVFLFEQPLPRRARIRHRGRGRHDPALAESEARAAAESGSRAPRRGGRQERRHRARARARTNVRRGRAWGGAQSSSSRERGPGAGRRRRGGAAGALARCELSQDLARGGTSPTPIKVAEAARRWRSVWWEWTFRVGASSLLYRGVRAGRARAPLLRVGSQAALPRMRTPRAHVLPLIAGRRAPGTAWETRYLVIADARWKSALHVSAFGNLDTAPIRGPVFNRLRSRVWRQATPGGADSGPPTSPAQGPGPAA